MSTFPVNPDLTSLAAAQANLKASAEAAKVRIETDRKEYYLNRTWFDWVRNVEAAAIPNTNPPKPPVGIEVFEFDPGWFSIRDSNVPVCEMPPLPQNRYNPNPAPPPPMNIHILKPCFDTNEPDGFSKTWFIAALDDTFPYGKKTPPIDLPGVTDGPHVCVRIGTVVGPGWYERVN